MLGATGECQEEVSTPPEAGYLGSTFRGPRHVRSENHNPDPDRASVTVGVTPPVSPVPAHRRFLDWLLLRAAVAKARAEEVASAPRAAMVRQAHAYVDAADTVLASDDKVALTPVLSLYREAIFLLVAKDLVGKKSLAVAFEIAPQSILADVGQNDSSLARLRHVLALHASFDAGDASVSERRDVARVTRSAVRAMLETADAGGLPQVLARRRWRAGFAVGALLAVVLTLVGVGIRLVVPRDLAAGQPWRASSVMAGAPPAKVLFQTTEEASPWFEIDLGSARRVTSLYVKNRSDCCQERAVPLVVEISFDRSNWQVVARTDSPFLVWEPSFPVVITRYVRLHSLHRTSLHFEQVKVF